MTLKLVLLGLVIKRNSLVRSVFVGLEDGCLSRIGMTCKP